MANVLVLGGGAREHCLAWKLKQSEKVANVYVAPGNSCPFSVNKSELVDANNLERVKEFCVNKKIELVLIGPEKPICDGWTDQLEKICSVFAPSKNASRLEASKRFAKEFMVRQKVPTAEFQAFTDQTKALEYVERVNWSQYVIKEDGLCAGKGVHICPNKQEARHQITELFKQEPNGQLVIEEFLDGYELSALCFSDGHHIAAFPFSQDHKRAFDGDYGENTGGMGAIAPVFVSNELQKRIHSLLQAVIDGMRAEGNLYKGVLYAGLMITTSGDPRILEFNCRFGDPETQVLLPLLKNDFYDVCLKSATGQLDSVQLEFESKRVACVVLASKGYPGSFEKNLPIKLSEQEGIQIFHAGLAHNNQGELRTSGGRILSVVSVEDSHFRAITNCLNYLDKLTFPGGFYRRDIGHFVTGTRYIDYAKSGVNIDEGNKLVDEIKADCARTLLPGTDKIGGFGALVDLAQMGYKQPQLVVGMDGVGTKIELATQANRLECLGFDLVGMCANDVLCHGAAPKVFLDYYVTGRLNSEQAARVVKSVAEACRQSGCALVGGETAEMPGVYEPHQWDLAGCCVGVKETSAVSLPQIDAIKESDILIGLASNGLHSNGFSLVRKTLNNLKIKLTDTCPWDETTTFADELLRPTRLYSKPLMPLILGNNLKALAHITGGGLIENVPRVLPNNLNAEIDCSAWEIGPVFEWLQQEGPVAPIEMFRTFNCSIGLVIVATKDQEATIVDHLMKQGIPSWTIGKVVARQNGQKGKKTFSCKAFKFLFLERTTLKNLNAVFRTVNMGHLRRPRVNVGVLISGTGSNMKRLIEQSQTRGSHCHISLVISNKSDVKGLETAASMGVETLVIPHGKCREEFELKVTKAFEERNVQLVCLAGFMRILTGTFVQRWKNRIINVHPALLPSFKGAHAVKLALEAGAKITGCTAHFVVEDVDAGEILAQEAVRIEPDDTEDSLHQKIQVHEHSMFPKVMEEVAAKMLEKQK